MRSALRLVWGLDVRHLTAHRARLALSAMGIAVGVSLAVGVGSLSSSITASLKSVVRATASKATIEIRPNGRSGLPPSVLAEALRTDGVDEAGATIESYAEFRANGARVRAFVVGVDQGIIAMSPGAASPDVIRSANPLGLILPASVARELHVRAGETLELTTPSGWRRIEIGTVLPPGETDRTRVVIGTVGVLQRLFDHGTTYDAIYVEARDVERTLLRIKEAVGDVGQVGPIAFRSSQVQQLLGAANASLAVGTVVALFVGAFLVFNTMSMAAVERLREAALLRAVGARRRQVFALFLAEGGVLGLIGSAIGVGAGVLLARQLLTQQGSAIQEVFPVNITSLEVSPRVLVGAGVAGVVAALAAAYLPARRVSRAEPAPALGAAGALEDPTRGPRRVTSTVGVVCAIVGPAITVPSVASGVSGSSLTLVGMTITLGGIALLIPAVVPLIARVFVGWISRMGKGLTRLSASEVLRSPGRTAFTVGAVLLSLALVVGFSIAQSSFSRAFEVRFRSIIAADLYVRSATWRIFGSDVPLDDRLAGEMEKIPGVEAAWPFRLTPLQIEDRPGIAIAYDTAKYGRYSHLHGAEKREVLEHARLLEDPNAILVSPSALSQLHHKIGDVIRLPTATGTHRLRIAGTLDDPSAINPELVFDYDTYKRVFGAGGTDTFGVAVTDASKIQAVKRAIDRRFASYSLQIDTAKQYRERLSSLVGSVQQLIGSVQLVAVIVAALGLANTLLISTLERRRDFGVLRATGMLRRQLRRMVATEALLIGVLGVVLAWGLGTLIGLAMFAFTRAQLGIPLRLVLPPSGYAGAAVLGVVAALAASFYPARRAGRTNVVEALQYE